MAKKKAAKKRKKTAEVGKTQISISLPIKLINKIDQLADEENRNRSNYIANVLREICEES